MRCFELVALEEEGFRPGLVSVVQAFADRPNFHPHASSNGTRFPTFWESPVVRDVDLLGAVA